MNKDARSWDTNTQETMRRQAVSAVLAGMPQVTAAKTFGVTRQAVGKWMVAHRKGGTKALRARAKGRPRTGGKITAELARPIIRAITDHCPDQLKLPFVLWTRAAVCQLIRQRYGITLSVSTMGRLLRRWGFTPQKPVRRAYEADPAAAKQWMEVEYPRIHRRAKAQKALLYCGDEMGLRADHQSGRSYAPRGKTPVIPGTGQRFGCNMISAITNRGNLCFMVFKRKFRLGVFLQFLKRLVKQAGRRKVFLIVDGHPVHRASGVRKWIEAQQDRIELFFLPVYRPDLNPDEFLNNDTKANAVGRQRPKHQQQLMAKVRAHLRRRKKNPVIVRRFFHAPSVTYAAA
jgi:transposase